MGTASLFFLQVNYTYSKAEINDNSVSLEIRARYFGRTIALHMCFHMMEKLNIGKIVNNNVYSVDIVENESAQDKFSQYMSCNNYG